MIFQVFPHPHMIFIHPLGGSGAAISPFIVVNICVALSKTICIFVGRPICLTWMAMNGVPWPLRCISRNNVQDRGQCLTVNAFPTWPIQ